MRPTIIGLFLGACLIVSLSFSAEVPTADQAYGTWNSFGAETDHYVFTIIEFDGDIVVGGLFNTVGSVPARSVARWDGSQWHAMGAGLHHAVQDLIIYGGNLYASVQLWTTSDETSTDTIATLAMWNGTEWTDIGFHSRENEHFHNMDVWNDMLIVTGDFTEADGAPGNNIAAWDGTQWHRLGDGLGGWVWDAEVFQNELYAIGDFAQTGSGTPAQLVARFDGSQWHPLASEIDILRIDEDATLATHNDQLLVGSWGLSLPGSDSIVNLATWNGTSWSAFAEYGQFGDIHHITNVDGRLYAGEWLRWFGDGNWHWVDWPYDILSGEEPRYVGSTRTLYVWDSIVVWGGLIYYEDTLKYGGLAWRPLNEFVCCDGRTGNADFDPDEKVDISDLTRLVNHLFVTFDPLECPAEANMSSEWPTQSPDVSDLTRLVNHLFVTYEALDYCH